MKNSKKKGLKLSRETLRSLSEEEQRRAGGAMMRIPTVTCRYVCFSWTPDCDLMQP